jgi:hypothetical protein
MTLVEFAINLHGVVAVNSGERIWGFAEMGLVFHAPLDPLILWYWSSTFALETPEWPSCLLQAEAGFVAFEGLIEVVPRGLAAAEG